MIGTDQGSFSIMTTESPENPGKAFIGVKDFKNELVLKEKYENSVFYKSLYYVIDWLAVFMKWLYLLSLGIGLFNLLPLPIVDGGRMLKLTFEKVYGKKKGTKKFGRWSLFFLLLLLASELPYAKYEVFR